MELAKQRLKEWAAQNHIRVPDFQHRTGYTYGHSYGLLRGNRPVTHEVVGRILVTYGASLAAWLVQPEDTTSLPESATLAAPAKEQE